MTWLIAIIVVLVLIGGCIFVYHSAEHHELHKMRAAFEDVEHKLINYFERENSILSKDGVTFLEPLSKETISGAGFAIQEVLKAIEREEKEIDHELLNYIKKLAKDLVHDKH